MNNARVNIAAMRSLDELAADLRTCLALHKDAKAKEEALRIAHEDAVRNAVGASEAVRRATNALLNAAEGGAGD